MTGPLLFSAFQHSHNSCCMRGCRVQGSRVESSKEALAREASTSSAALSISAISLPSKASWPEQARGVLQSTALSEEIQPSPDTAAGLWSGLTTCHPWTPTVSRSSCHVGRQVYCSAAESCSAPFNTQDHDG